MSTLNDLILDIRERQRIKPSPSNEPAATWTGKDHHEGGVSDTLTIIFRTAGCWWGNIGGCSMCGYVYDKATTPPNTSDLEEQYERALSRADKLDNFILKIFTSGSFLDEKEISEEARILLLQKMAEDKRIIKVIVETRPVFATKDVLKQCTEILGGKPFEIATGLETSSDNIRARSINKGFTFASFEKAALAAKETGTSVKAYLLLKPPFLSEREAIEDILQTIDDVADKAQTISINLCNVQRGTLVEQLWERDQYRPPWLWSIVEILKKGKEKHPELVITSDPVGAGSKRGPRNCRKCSREIADVIRDFSLTQDTAILSKANCECKGLWKTVLELDDRTFGSPIMD
ncbi:radical SAM enzyme (TIGR01210 family) [Methanohalophilus levihalophilus]|uniref:archaeosine biosynthesis radical SAM protein RaSEA n=1 Tax=Methanohalophilus levihalophilus TaxID=1431282 RepID=UPI001AE3FD6C|nr:archaeosine biosynthesis radical SAM protein RaSEA [Methanohalophilus levihalophilus]MBP2029277.1 radical SAM enzyme (TIGR01210 family) [Methanohalophilus levihalophilus]